MLLKDPTVFPPRAGLLVKIDPEGLTDERKRYLYREIRQFCKPGTEDLVTRAPWNIQKLCNYYPELPSEGHCMVFLFYINNIITS